MAGLFQYTKSIPIADEVDVVFRVKFISNGNFGRTDVDVPGPNDKSFKNADAVVLGKGKDLRSDSIYCVSNFVNLIPAVSEIKVNYFINDILIVEHVNSKEETSEPTISIVLKIEIP